MRCQGLLLLCESHRRRRWCRLGDHLSASHCCRRGSYSSRTICPQSEHTLSRGSHCSSRTHRRRSHLPRVHSNRGSSHRLRADESPLLNRRHCSRYISVHIRDIRNVGGFVDDGGVVDIGDRCRVDGRVADVDPVDVFPAHAIRRYVDFARAEGKPSHIAAEPATLTDKDHQRGRVHRHYFHRPGYPTPTPANGHPAPVVKRGVAPRRIIYPCPTPGSNPVPVAFPIRCPPGGNPVGEPDMPVVGIVAPVAVVIQIRVTNEHPRERYRAERDPS